MKKEQDLLTKFKETHFTMVALGDSNTEQNHWTGAGLNWLGMVSVNIRFVCRNGYTVINSGVSGDTAAGALERIDRDVLRFAPDLVIIAFGLNDSCLTPSPESFIKNLDLNRTC
jgi:lysophospholipase L1-like esterase